MMKLLILLLFHLYSCCGFILPSINTNFNSRPLDPFTVWLQQQQHSSGSQTSPSSAVAGNSDNQQTDFGGRLAVLEAVKDDTETVKTNDSLNEKDEVRVEPPKRSSSVLPFLRVNWNNKPSSLSEQWTASSSTSKKKSEKSSSAAFDVPIRQVSLGANNISSALHSPQNKTNTTTAFDSSDKNSSTTSSTRPPQTPIPVAETILRNIYGKASESAIEMAAWNMSQFFPHLPEVGLANSANQSTMLLPGKKPTDVLTVKDLERILKENGYVRQIDVVAALQSSVASTPPTLNPSLINSPIEGLGQPVSDLLRGPQDSATSTPSSTLPGASQVAFPQPSVLSYTSLKWGVTAASAISCTVLATSILPSLWLMGGLVGSLYGYQTGKRLSDGTIPKSFFPSFLLVFGRRIAKSYLQVYDMFNALFFMYKTGQLSYSMWRRYAEIDQRFQIQDKIDAWVSCLAHDRSTRLPT